MLDIHKSQKYLDTEFKGFFYLRKNYLNNKALYNVELLDIPTIKEITLGLRPKRFFIVQCQRTWYRMMQCREEVKVLDIKVDRKSRQVWVSHNLTPFPWEIVASAPRRPVKPPEREPRGCNNWDKLTTAIHSARIFPLPFQNFKFESIELIKFIMLK